MSQRVFLAIDLGAESGRVIAGLLQNGKIALDEIHRFPNGPVDVAGTRRWNVVGLWQQILKGLQIAADRYGNDCVSLGVDTWGVDYVLLSKHDEILGQPYNYRDPRTDGMIEYACSKVPRAEIFSQTGLQFIPINSLYQVLAMQQSDPELLAFADRFLMMPDFFHWLLCGSRVVEFTNATTTQFVHPETRTWALDLLRKLEIPPHLFPEIVTPGTRLGSLRESVAKETGLNRIEVVAPPTHDTAAAVAAIPTERTGAANWAYISSGTWSLIGVEVQQAILSDEALAQNVTNEGGVDNTYRLLKNVMGLWLIQECRRIFERQGKSYGYSELTQLASEAEPFRSIVDANAAEFLSPENMVTSLQDWCRRHGEPVPETEGQLVRCGLESLALTYRKVLEGIEGLTGEKIDVIHIVGGGCQSHLLNQFTANACHKQVVAGPTEATALGNVLIQARAAGDIGSLSEIREVVRNSYQLETFEPADDDAWDSAYERYRKLTS